MNDEKALIKLLSDDQLSELHSSILKEKERRIVEKLEQGIFPKPNDQELDFLKDFKEIQAIKDYRSRTNVSLTEARYIIKYYNNTLLID